MVEAARICNENGTPNTETLFMGVEKNQYGAPVRYHIRDQHPDSIFQKNRTWTKRDAFNENTGLRNVLHLYRPLRPGQTRGYPYLTPVIETLKQLDWYTEAEIMAAVVSDSSLHLSRHSSAGTSGT
jgi:capsid protein